MTVKLAATLAVCLSLPAAAQLIQIPPRRTVAQLPAPAPANLGAIYSVTDGLTEADCVIGGGAAKVHLCISTGTAWEALASGEGNGPPGEAATISVGSTSTGAPGSSAGVINSGTSSAAVLDFTIPRGDAGPMGEPPSFARLLYVDSAGAGDYTSIKAACDFVVAQSPGPASQWTILVEPGAALPGLGYDDLYNYIEAPLEVPPYTTVQGVSSAHNLPTGFGAAPIIQFTGTAGAQVTLGAGTALKDLALLWVGTPAGEGSVVDIPAGRLAVLDNVSINVLPFSGDFPWHGVTAEGFGYMYDSSVALASPFVPTGASAVRVTPSESGAGLALYQGRFFGGGSCSALFWGDGSAAAGYPMLKLFDVRIDGGCETDIVATGGGVVENYGSFFATSIGTVDSEDVRGETFRLGNQCRMTSGSGSPEGSVSGSPCDTYFNTAGGAATSLCVKESGSATTTGWRCVGGAAMSAATAGTAAGASTNPGNCSSGLPRGVDAAWAAEGCADVALGADTSGSYAAGDGEAGNATGLACSGCVDSADLAADAVTSAKVGFNYAGSASEAGPATSALAVTGFTASRCARFDGSGNLVASSADCPNGDTSGSSGLGGSTGSVDNAALRSDGAGGATAQASDLIIGDTASSAVPITTAPGTSLSLTSATGIVRFATTERIQIGGSTSSENALRKFGNYLGVEKADDSSGGLVKVGLVDFQGGSFGSVAPLVRIDGGGSGSLSMSSGSVVSWYSTTPLTAGSADWGFARTGTGAGRVTDGGSGDGALTGSRWRDIPQASPPITCGDANTLGWHYTDTSGADCWCDGTTWQKEAGAGSCA